MSVHVDSDLPEYLLGALEGAQASVVDAHLRRCASCRRDLRSTAEALTVPALALRPVQPPAALRRRVLASVRSPRHRLSPFIDRVARLMDLSVERVEALLVRLHDPDAWEPAPWPQVRWIHFDGGPALAGADAGFVRIPAGARFPHHEHVGAEDVFVLQGTLQEDNGTVVGRGHLVRHAAGSAHAFQAAGEDDLVTAVVARGLRFR